MVGGTPFARGKLNTMLSNPIYDGRIRHKGDVFSGQHEAIVDQDLWQAVQDRLAGNARATKTGARARSPSPLAGRLLDPDGEKMRPTHATTNGRRYRYYISAGLVEGSIATGARGWRIPAAEIEAAVARTIAARLRETQFVSEMLRSDEAAAVDPKRLADLFGKIAQYLDDPAGQPPRLMLAAIVDRASVSETEMQADVRFAGLTDVALLVGLEVEPLKDLRFAVAEPIRMARRGAELRLILQGAAAPARRPDSHLVREIIAARVRVADYIASGGSLGISDLAERDGIDVADASRSMQLAFLAPDLVERILDGDQPVGLTTKPLKLVRELPLVRSEQHDLLA